MATKEEMIKGLDALENLLKEQAQLGRDGLIFIFEHNLWKEFMEYYSKKYIDRELPEKIYGYNLFELKQIINFAKSRNFELREEKDNPQGCG